MHSIDEHVLTGIIVTGDNGVPLYERKAIRSTTFQDFRNFTSPPHLISGETYIPKPYIVSYISGHNMKQYANNPPPINFNH